MILESGLLLGACMTGEPPLFKAPDGNAPFICIRSLASFKFK